MSVYVRFECGRDDREGPTLGPFDFLQVTYQSLRRDPDGEIIAEMEKDGDWYLVDTKLSSEPWSDFIIYTE